MNGEELAERKRRLRVLVLQAWEGVTHEGGTSHFDSVVADAWGDVALVEGLHPEMRRSHRTIEEVDADPDWSLNVGDGGFSFYDAIGFRFFLGAALLRMLRTDGVEECFFHLHDRPESSPKHDAEQRSLVDARQRSVTALLLLHLAQTRLQRVDRGEWVLASLFSDLLPLPHWLDVALLAGIERADSKFSRKNGPR